MAPIDVYNSVAGYTGVFQTTMCAIKSKCVQYALCENKSSSIVLDFDQAAKTYKKAVGLPQTPPTVDAIAVDDARTILILIEKKTWGAFFTMSQNGITEDLQTAALAKVSTYDLQGKYQSTRNICEHITDTRGLFDTLPHVFVFLTEMSDSDPTGGFATYMGNLANTSSVVDYQTQTMLVDAMRAHLGTVTCRKSRYLSCQELDYFIEDPNMFD